MSEGPYRSSPMGRSTVDPEPGPMRQRSKQACQPCRQRKRKCDGKFPCNICKGYGYDCEYGSKSKPAPPKRPATSDTVSAPPPVKAPRIAQAQAMPKQYTDSSILPGVLAPPKPRYVGRYSSVAFPLYAGLEVQATKLPRLHSFGYHAGIREEPPCAVNHALVARVSWNIARSLIDVYTAVIHPVFGFYDLNLLNALCEKHWHGQAQDIVFEAMICGVIALGSFFSDILDKDTEMWVIYHAKDILEDASISRFPTVESIAAWILRTIYVRSTGRPHVAWMCSCTLMHLVEAAGLHQVPEFLMQATGGSGAPQEELINTVDRTALVANAVHILIAFEYGRSIMTFGRQGTEKTYPSHQGVNYTSQLCKLVAAIPTSQDTGDRTDIMHELLGALENISEMTLDHDFLLLLRADLALGIYRRLRVMDPHFQQGQNDLVIGAGISALSAARRLASQKQPWWNIVGTVFQFACALLVMDTNASCVKLSDTMDALEFIVNHFNTHLAKEALSTIHQLARASLNKKRESVEALERAVGISNPGVTPGESQFSQDFGVLSPSLMTELPVDLDHLWAMDFQFP